jgi:hypothetical protein
MDGRYEGFGLGVGVDLGIWYNSKGFNGSLYLIVDFGNN